MTSTADPGSGSTEADRAELTAFVRAFTKLVEEAHLLAKSESSLTDDVAAHLGADPSELTPVGVVVPRVDRPNLQLALDEFIADDTDSRLIGLSPELAHFGGVSLSTIVSGKLRGPGHPVPPVYDEVPIDVDEKLPCVNAGLWLTSYEGEPIVVGVLPGEPHHGPWDQDPRVEVLARARATAEAVHARLLDRRRALNIYRGKVLAFTHSEYGDFGIDFVARPTTSAEDVILPDADLSVIERHTIEMAQVADELRSAEQHLKRGLLLYGPPGTGKTHTISYLMAAMPERTCVILQGPSIGALGHGSAIVRSLPPSMLVIEDVDLIASERGMPGTHHTNPLLFQLLNEMDGLNPDDDVLFVLTTNRADVLEPALAARPGRIDQAVEIALPNEASRERLLRLYLKEAVDSIDDIGRYIESTEGKTASFMRELVRRATFFAIRGGGETLSDSELQQALDELLASPLPVGESGGVQAEHLHDATRLTRGSSLQ